MDFVADTERNERLVEATVVELMPQAKFRLELDNKDQVLAHSASATTVNYMRIRPGDKVRVELSPHDRTRGRIVKLLTKEGGGK